jgi:hypothetical protein
MLPIEVGMFAERIGTVTVRFRFAIFDNSAISAD